MLGEVIRLPLRVGVRVAQLCLRATDETLGAVADTAGRLIDIAVPRESVLPQTRPAPPPPAPPQPVPEAAPPQPVPEPAPTHVSTEPELVEQVAEPGAEDGAGAELHVREPWDGYGRMNAADVIDRLSVSNAAELAAVELYENEHKGRATVLQAVEHELRTTTGNDLRHEERG